MTIESYDRTVILLQRRKRVVEMPKQTFMNLPEDKRQWILECAIDEFSEHGYSGASISRLVSAAKIAKGSFYQYFEDKEDLYAYLLDYALVSYKMRISDEESVKLEGITLTEFLRILLKRMTGEFFSRPKLLKISVDFLRHQNEPFQKSIAEKYAPVSGDYFQHFIREEKSRNEIDLNVDNDMLSYMLMGATNEIVNMLLTKDPFSITPDYIDKWVDRVEYILTNGIYKNTTHS